MAVLLAASAPPFVALFPCPPLPHPGQHLTWHSAVQVQSLLVGTRVRGQSVWIRVSARWFWTAGAGHLHQREGLPVRLRRDAPHIPGLTSPGRLSREMPAQECQDRRVLLGVPAQRHPGGTLRAFRSSSQGGPGSRGGSSPRKLHPSGLEISCCKATPCLPRLSSRALSVPSFDVATVTSALPVCKDSGERARNPGIRRLSVTKQSKLAFPLKIKNILVSSSKINGTAQSTYLFASQTNPRICLKKLQIISVKCVIRCVSAISGTPRRREPGSQACDSDTRFPLESASPANVLLLACPLPSRETTSGSRPGSGPLGCHHTSEEPGALRATAVNAPEPCSRRLPSIDHRLS